MPDRRCCTFAADSPANERAVLLASAPIFFALNVVVSGVAPYFPVYAAEHHGASPLAVGLVMACMPGAGSLSARPVSSVLLPRFGRTRVIIFGLCTVSFGCLLWGIAGSMWAFALARMVMGAGMSCSWTGLSSLMMEYTEDLARALAVQEGFAGVGFVAGPVFGGVMYDLLGLTGTAFFQGGLLLAFAPLALKLLLPLKEDEKRLAAADKPAAESLSIFHLLKDSCIFMGALNICFSMLVYSAFEATYARHWKTILGTTATTNGLIMALSALVYAYCNFPAATLTNKYGARKVMTFGCLLFGLGFALTAPSAFMGPGNWSRAAVTVSVLCGVAMTGMAFPAIWIPGLPLMRSGAKANPTIGSDATDALAGLSYTSTSAGPYRCYY